MDDKKNWYAVYTKPRWEKKVYRLFEEKKMEAYCPLNKVSKKWSDRIKIVEEPLFRSYVFVKVSDEEKAKVRTTNGVVNFIYEEGKPAVIYDREITVIKKFLNEYNNVTVEAIHLAPEGKVKIQTGAFMDKEARVIRVQGNKVKVNIESIGFSLIAFVDKSNLLVIEK